MKGKAFRVPKGPALAPKFHMEVLDVSHDPKAPRFNVENIPCDAIKKASEIKKAAEGHFDVGKRVRVYEVIYKLRYDLK